MVGQLMKSTFTLPHLWFDWQLKIAFYFSTIKCGCRWPVHPCLLCTGRTDPTAPRDLPDMMSTQESVALLDPCYHPILSFPEGVLIDCWVNWLTNTLTFKSLYDQNVKKKCLQISDVSQNIYMEATLRQPEWQTRVAKASSKAIIKNVLALQKASERDENRGGLATTGVVSRKNSDALHSTINSKKMTSKKFKIVSNSKFCSIPHFFLFFSPTNNFVLNFSVGILFTFSQCSTCYRIKEKKHRK